MRKVKSFRFMVLLIAILLLGFGTKVTAEEPKEVSESLYSFLEGTNAGGPKFEIHAPALDYSFRSPSCFKGRRKDLHRKFGETLSSSGYVNTAWELTMTSYVHEKPESWSEDAFSRFQKIFGGYDGVRGILVYLREDGVIGYGKDGVAFNSENTWLFEEMRITLNLGEFGLKMDFPLEGYGRPSYLMIKDASRSSAITVMLRVLDSYKNMFYAISPGTEFSQNIERAMNDEAKLPELDCWEGNPENLDAIPGDYWFFD